MITGKVEEHSRVLVVGACALDRLLHVQKYPKEDAKIKCHQSFEFGGGNAANTASGLGRMSSAKVSSSMSDNGKDYVVQLLTKVADDDVKNKICHELLDFSVNLSSALFVHGPKGSKSPVATVIVSNDDSHSRTCIFDQGSCGVLEQSDVERIDMNILFRGVLLLHSDSRHTEAAVLLAREARNRSIPISLDVERDRLTRAFDDLIDLASIVFTSGNHLKDIIRRRLKNNNTAYVRDPTMDDDLIPTLHSNIVIDSVSILYNLMLFRNDFKSNNNELIMTRGHHGVIHSRLTKYDTTIIGDGHLAVETTCNNLKTKTINEDDGRIILSQYIQTVVTPQPLIVKVEKIEYQIYCIGPPYVQDVVDSTGAGDAFAAGYLWSELILSQYANTLPNFNATLFKLRMGSWCAGKKLSGPGARVNLPTSKTVNDELGCDIHSIFKSLEHKVAKTTFL